MFRLALLISLYAFPFFSFCQTLVDTTGVLDPVPYQQDFAKLQQALRQTYPSLYRFQNKHTVDRVLDSCYRSIRKGIDPTNFYATVKYVLSFLEDGHLSCSPSPSLRQHFEEQRYFPLSLVFLKDGAYNYCDHSGIPKGAKIISINNIPIERIKERLYAYLVSDGNIKTAKDWTLNTTFWFYYYLAYGSMPTFQVGYKMSSGVLKEAIVTPVLRSQFTCSGYQFSQPTDLLALSFPQKDVAVMTIQTFTYQQLTEAKKDFGVFLDSCFKEINGKGVSKLIIDLRGNGGGADVYGSYLYSYLTNRPFSYYKELQTVEKKLTIADHPNLAIQKPNDIYYKGKLFILINGLTFSAAAEFCAIAKSNKRALFIGEETGGTYCGNTSGNSVNTLLPNTGISVSLPTTKYVMAVKSAKQSDRGIFPDYTVLPTIEAVLSNRDTQLSEAIKLAAVK